MIKTVIVGAGGIALKHAEALNRLPNVKVAGVMDLKYENARRIADICNSRVIENLSDVLEEIQMIHLLTPPSKRMDYAEIAIKARKHILCEKPISANMSDAQKLMKLAKENNVLFMVAFNMRFRSGYIRLCEKVLSGMLGNIISIWIHRIGPGPGFNKSLSSSWRTDPEFLCGMTIESLSHDIDMIRGLGVEITTVSARVKGSLEEMPLFDNNAQVVLGLSCGASAIINTSWSSYLLMSSRGVNGTKGTVVVNGKDFFDFSEHIEKTEKMSKESITFINDQFDSESFYEENKHFTECIESGTKPFIGAEHGLEALKVSLAILKSSKEQRLIKLRN